MNQMITIAQINKHIVSITDFRRNAGAYLDRLSENGPYTIIRGSQIVGHVIPASNRPEKHTTDEKIKKLHNISGGLHLGKTLTADKMNTDYDKTYEEMLP